MDDVLEENIPRLPLDKQKEKSRDWRQVGIGQMGLSDMLIKLGVKYGSCESIEISKIISNTLINQCVKKSSLLAKDRGTFPKYDYNSLIKSDFYNKNISQDVKDIVGEYGMRNCALTSLAPCGSISTMISTSGGIEPIFNFSYTRKTESIGDKEQYYKVYTKIAKDYMDEFNIENEDDLPLFFITSHNIDYNDRIKMQSTWQENIDTAISSTINLPNSATENDIKDIYIKAWENGLKGITVFRDGCLRSGILTNDEGKNIIEEEIKELKRGEWEDKPKGCIEISKKIYSGCGKMTLHIGILPKEKRVFDVYVTNSSKGGCTLNIQNIAITISNLLRIGGNLKSLEKSFEGAGSCPSFAMARAKDRKVSKGNSCGSAILNILLGVEKDLQNECLEELQELGYYNNIKNVESIDVDECKVPIEMLKKITNTTYTKADNSNVKFTQEEIEFLQENGDSAFAQRFNKCPICGETEGFNHIGGCVQCSSCSYSKCD